MLKSRTFLRVAGVLLACGFVWGLAHLLALRFDSGGDVYPAYSSLRADPLGAMAFYESLESLPRFQTERQLRSFSKVETGKNTVLFILGTRRSELDWMSRSEWADFQRFFASGGRVVIALYPEPGSVAQANHLRAPPSNARKRMSRDQDDKSQPETAEETNSLPLDLQLKWGFRVGMVPLDLDADHLPIPAAAKLQTEEPDLPKSIPWHSGIVFQSLDDAWQTVYTRKNEAVIIEREMGNGALVLCADSYLFSNEALRAERRPALLAWLAGPTRRAIFDEMHLGLSENPGVASMMRQYRLHGLILGLLIVAGLYIWRNATSLAPPDPDELHEAGVSYVAGKDSTSGLVNLLRRNIPRSKILETCAAEWKKTAAAREQKDKIAEVDVIVRREISSPAPDPVRAYGEIASILSKKRT